MSDCAHGDPHCQCAAETSIVGRMVLPTNALLDVTGSTPVKLLLHEDGTITWKPLYEVFAPNEGQE